MKILLDLNILLDVLGKREPHYGPSAGVWEAVETGDVEGLIAAHSITTLHYLLTRPLGSQQAATCLQQVLNIYAVADVNQEVIYQTLSLGWADFEDAVQMAAAAHAGADYLITRNRKVFERGPVTVLQPGEFLALLLGTQQEK